MVKAKARVGKAKAKVEMAKAQVRAEAMGEAKTTIAQGLVPPRRNLAPTQGPTSTPSASTQPSRRVTGSQGKKHKGQDEGNEVTVGKCKRLLWRVRSLRKHWVTMEVPAEFYWACSNRSNLVFWVDIILGLLY